MALPWQWLVDLSQKIPGAPDLDLSKDAAQQFLYLADAGNEKVHILRRDALQELKAFGDGGHYPGQFYGVHNLAVDSKGNLYTGETFDGKRVQRFLLGLASLRHGAMSVGRAATRPRMASRGAPHDDSTD